VTAREPHKFEQVGWMMVCLAHCACRSGSVNRPFALQSQTGQSVSLRPPV